MPDNLPEVDKRLYDVVFAEAGGGPVEEIAAVTSVFINRIMKHGYDRALQGSSAYTTQSEQYKKASTGDLNVFERLMYKRNKRIVDSLIQDPKRLQPYTHFENTKKYGEPSWASSMESYKDIGRQRFYIEPQNPRVKVLEK